MYKEHRVFKKPANLNTRIWKYMDFTKFVSLLDSSALFFVTPEELKKQDPFEGAIPQVNKTLLTTKLVGAVNLEEIWSSTKLAIQGMARYCVVSCWHINEYESAAMWKLYLSSNEVVAVQSTFNFLCQCFDADKALNYKDNELLPIYVGEVQYIDYDNHPIPDGNLFYSFMHKRRNFEHERELRAMTVLWPNRYGSNNLHLFEEGADFPDLIKQLQEYQGIYIPINPNILIERIFVSPTAPKWFKGLVQSIVEKFGLDVKVEQSTLGSQPIS